MSCDPTVGWPTGSCPTQKKCPQTEEDAKPCDKMDCQLYVDPTLQYCRGKKGFLFFVPEQKPKTLPAGFFYDPEDTITRNMERRGRAGDQDRGRKMRLQRRRRLARVAGPWRRSSPRLRRLKGMATSSARK